MKYIVIVGMAIGVAVFFAGGLIVSGALVSSMVVNVLDGYSVLLVVSKFALLLWVIVVIDVIGFVV